MEGKKGSASLMNKEKPTVKQCKHCKSEIPYDAKVCPVCRKKQGAPGCLIVVLVVVVLVVIAAFAGGGALAACGSNRFPANYAQTAARIEAFFHTLLASYEIDVELL